jgi:NHLM bacteriocin system ABC transporter ATP-binding protein
MNEPPPNPAPRAGADIGVGVGGAGGSGEPMPAVLDIAGNAPLDLAPGACWRVEAGQVEVFAVRAPAGSRFHLATAGPGQLLAGAAAEDGLALLAVGSQGTRLRRVDLAAADAGDGDGLAAAIEGWIGGLLGELPLPAAPKLFTELRPGAAARLPDGQAGRPQSGLVWVRTAAAATGGGGVLWLGRPELRVDALLPVPEGAWITAPPRPAGEPPPADAEAAEPPGVDVECLTTAALLGIGANGASGDGGDGGGGIAAGLERFHRLFLRLVSLELAERDERERRRLGRKAELDVQTLHAASLRLASVIAERLPAQPETETAGDPLLAVCRLVGAPLGIVFRSPQEIGVVLRTQDRLSAICTASRVRSRRVLLRDGWWRADQGPLLAFRLLDEQGKQRRPVALLPVGPGRYELVDPAEPAEPKRRRPVDGSLQDLLAGEAVMFYPPLPEGPLGAGDLLRAALRNRRGDLATVVWMGLAGGVLGLLLPILTGQIFGTAVPSANRSQLGQMALALMVSSLAAAAFQVTRSIAVLRLSGKVDGVVQSGVWDRLLSLPVAFFRRYSVGELAERAMGINAIRELVTGNVLTSILAAVFSLFSFGLLFYYSPRLALVATALVLALAALTALMVYLQLRHQRQILAFQGKVSSLLFGLIGGIAKLRVAGAERRAYALWARRFADQRERTLRAQRTANVQATLNAMYPILTSLAVFAMVGFSAGEERLPLGAFLAFYAAFGQFLASALSMVAVFSTVLAAVPIFERLRPILVEPPEVDASKAEPGELAGDVELSHVSFRYHEGGPLILDDVSLRARPGEFIALVGPSGAGKSTCLRLLLGFEKPTSGSIYFDGQDLAALGLQAVRRQLGVVLQTGRPMVGDIYTNIVGTSTLTLADAWEAARMAGLEEDIKAMPMGMHTVISEGAETFSGGQKQRLLIARAVVHRPRILLFDEATSALDNRTQEIVSRSLERLKATRIVIAHRLSTIQNADRIYVMEAGRVVEAGSYGELMQNGGVFSRLAARQIA